MDETELFFLKNVCSYCLRLKVLFNRFITYNKSHGKVRVKRVEQMASGLELLTEVCIEGTIFFLWFWSAYGRLGRLCKANWSLSGVKFSCVEAGHIIIMHSIPANTVSYSNS
jgi:hypothetical protein